MPRSIRSWDPQVSTLLFVYWIRPRVRHLREIVDEVKVILVLVVAYHHVVLLVLNLIHFARDSELVREVAVPWGRVLGRQVFALDRW